MSLATSTDYGLTWKNLGQIITGTTNPTVGKNTGEGDCTALNGLDNYYYLYCGRPRDGTLIVARAPVSNPQPGNWKKFFQANWDQPGLGGDATSLGKDLGTSAARWKTTGETLLLGWVRGGVGLFFSTNHITFALRVGSMRKRNQERCRFTTESHQCSTVPGQSSVDQFL